MYLPLQKWRRIVESEHVIIVFHIVLIQQGIQFLKLQHRIHLHHRHESSLAKTLIIHETPICICVWDHRFSCTAGGVFFWYGPLASFSHLVANLDSEHHNKSNRGSNLGLLLMNPECPAYPTRSRQAGRGAYVSADRAPCPPQLPHSHQRPLPRLQSGNMSQNNMINRMGQPGEMGTTYCGAGWKRSEQYCVWPQRVSYAMSASLQFITLVRCKEWFSGTYLLIQRIKCLLRRSEGTHTERGRGVSGGASVIVNHFK